MNAFEARKAESQYWFNKSSDMRASAAALWMSTEADIAARIVRDCELGRGFLIAVAVSRVFSMLCGMALELILKAVIVERGKPVNESTHELLHHVASAGISYTQTERELLRVLSHDIAWGGRYPAPKKEGQMADYTQLVRKVLFERVPLGTMTVLRRNEALGWASFNELWLKAAHEYFSIKA